MVVRGPLAHEGGDLSCQTIRLWIKTEVGKGALRAIRPSTVVLEVFMMITVRLGMIQKRNVERLGLNQDRDPSFSKKPLIR